MSPGIFATRKQFPLCLSYSVTVHKSQGLTLDMVLLDLGKDIFTDGQSYVAVSRVRSLAGVHIALIDISRINANTDCVNQYNNWRVSIGLP